MSLPKVSVIVAIYKTENFLCRCVDSLLAQTFDDFEILLIDDGSPDNCGHICDEYARQDSRIRIFHKKNGGVASARQYGIDNALGEYTIHVDPDDWVEPDMLDELYQKAKEDDVDIVICDYFEIRHEEAYVKQEPTALVPDVVLRDLLKGRLHGSCCNKLIKRTCYEKYNVSFPIGFLFEDIFVFSTLCMHDVRISYLPKAFYHYDRMINKSSLSQVPNRANVQSRITLVSYLESHLDQSVYQNEVNRLKCLTKKVAWASQLYSEVEFMSLYKEINDVYASYQETKSPTSRCVLLCLRGHYRLAKILYASWCFIRKFL